MENFLSSNSLPDGSYGMGKEWKEGVHVFIHKSR